MGPKLDKAHCAVDGIVLLFVLRFRSDDALLMRIEPCSVCGANVYPGHGSLYLRNDAKQFRFCRSKCHKTFKMKRNPRYLRWTKAYRRSHGKEMVNDLVFEFERQRHRVLKYDREVVGNTIEAMKRIERIKESRQDAFYRERVKVRKTVERRQAETEVARHQLSANVELLDVAKAASAMVPLEATTRREAMERMRIRVGTAAETGVDGENGNEL